MLASAAGDASALGYETGKRVPKPGATMSGGGYGFEPGEWTDDTCGSIAVALGRSVPLEVAKGLLSWFWTRPPDIGITTRAVLSRTTSPRGMLAASKAHGCRMAARPQACRLRSGRPQWQPDEDRPGVPAVLARSQADSRGGPRGVGPDPL